LVPEPTVIIDAGPLVALIDRRDSHHAWASTHAQALVAPFLTSESVLCEVAFLLQRGRIPTRHLFDLLAQESILVVFDLQAEYAAAAALMSKYAHLPKGASMSLADASLVRLAESHDRAAVFTLDRHFAIYRKHGRRQIPLIAPWTGSDH
jgi:uncharacterized protein